MQYYEPNFVDEALVLLDRFAPGARVLAGGTLLGPQLRSDPRGADTIVNIKRIPDLSDVTLDGDRLTIGAVVTARELAEHQLVRRHAPLLAEAAASLGARQLRSVATIGGNLCSGHPAADLSAALLASDAFCLVSNIHEGPREIALEAFLRPRSHAMESGELLTGIALPGSTAGAAYAKMQTRRAFEMALVAVAVRFAGSQDGTIEDARIALAGAAPTPLRAARAEAALNGRPPSPKTFAAAARAAAEHDAKPYTDRRASAEYRRHLVFVLTERALAEAQLR
jgi:aerobic carbon-monoxide dehydrogenase medium subunit